jgi:UPF0716 protein FxsA
MPLVLLFLLFIVLPLAELYVIIQLAGVIGILPTIALLLIDSIVGTMLMKSQGRAAWQRFNEANAEGRIPAREVADGALIILGGAFLLTPGFITDIFGLLFLFPPTRVLLRGLLVRRGALRVVGAMPGTSRPPQNGRPHDIEGTAVDVDSDRLDPPR